MKKENVNILELEKQYNDVIKLYADFAVDIKKIVNKILKNSDINFHVIVYREKSFKSIKDNILTGDKYKNIKQISDIVDLAGVRVIFYFKSEIEKAIPLIKDEFGEKNIKVDPKIKDNGYEAIHIILKKLNNERLTFIEYAKYGGMKCEIQLNTILRQAWSGVEHNFYKRKEEMKILSPRYFTTIKRLCDEAIPHINNAQSLFERIDKNFKNYKTLKSFFTKSNLEKIEKSNSNDFIFENLEFLEESIINFNKELSNDFNIVRLLKDILSKSRKNKATNEKTVFGIMPGKTYAEIAIKTIEILEHIRYLKTKEVFDLLVVLFHHKDKSISERAVRAIENLTEYNYNVLKKIGYSPQRFILDIILSWSEKEKIKNSEIIKIIARKLLEPSFEGTSTSAWNKITMQSGALSPDEFLGKIRRDIVSLLIELYHKTEGINEKISILSIFEAASMFPIQMYKENFEKMVYDDVDRVVKFYLSIIFNGDNKIIAPAAIVQEVEKQLIWISKRQKNQNDDITAFLAKLQKDKFYGLFRLFVGDILDRLKDTEDWQGLEKNRKEEISKKLKSINSDNINQWIIDLNKIAGQKDHIDDWKFEHFDNFLRILSSKKPNLANLIITDAFENKKPLAMYADNFLFGFRRINKIDYWDKLSQKIIDTQNVDLIAGIFCTYDEALINNIRTKDVDLLADIINKRNKFKFLSKEKFKKYEDFRLRHSIIIALLNLYYKDKVKIEKLILAEMKANNKPQYVNIYLNQIYFYAHNKLEYKIIPDWSNKGIEYLCEVLVNTKSLDYYSQQLLIPIGQRDFNAMMNILWRRIKLSERKKNRKLGLAYEHYNAMPYQLNPDLEKFIAGHPDCPKIINDWLFKQKTGLITRWKIGQLKRIIHFSLDKILIKNIESGDPKKIEVVIDLYGLSSEPGYDLLFKAVEHLKNEKLWNKIISIFYRTGVVSGEYGISEAYKRRVEEIKRYEEKYTKAKHKKVLKFIKKLKDSLEKSATHQRQREDEEIKIREIEFGG